MAMIKNPLFARASTYSVMEKAFEEGGVFFNLDRIAYIYVLDTGILYHASVDKIIRPVVGDNPKYVQRFDELPSPDVSEEGVLYVVGDTVYSFHDGAFHPTYEDVLTPIDELNTKVDNLEADYTQFKTDVADEINTFKTDVESEITTFKTDVDNEINTLRTDVEADIASVRTDLEGEMASYKTEVDNELDTFSTTVVDLDGRVTELQSDVASIRSGMSSLDRSVTALGRQVQGKADKATTLSGYGITDAYTKSETKALLGDTGGETMTQYVNETVSDAMGLIEV